MPVKKYDGTNWVTVAGTGVQGPTGPAGASATTVVTTKGDLLTYSTTAARLGVGTNGQALIADSTASTGLKWGTPSSGMTLITSSTFTASSAVNVDSVFSSTYTNYRIVMSLKQTTGADFLFRLRQSGSTNSTSNYYLSGTSSNAFYDTLGATSFTIGRAMSGKGGGSIDLYGPNVGTNIGISSTTSGIQSGVGNSSVTVLGNYDGTYAADGFSLIPASGTITGTVEVYGYAK